MYFRELSARAIAGNQTTGSLEGQPHFYALPHDENRAYMKKIDNDLEEQVRLVGHFFRLWVDHGDPIPPYFPSRICVILRKHKRADLEFDFLHAYVRHFTDTTSPRNTKMIERAAKIGAL